MDVDNRGFSYRPVYPRWFEPDFHERLSAIISSPEFAAVMAAFLHYLIGYLNVMFFVGAIIAICVSAFSSLVMRDGIYDPDTEKKFILDIRPRLLYILTGGLLRYWRPIFWALTAPFWLKPEDLIPGKILLTVTIVIVGFLYFERKADFWCLNHFRNASYAVMAWIGALFRFISHIFRISFQRLPWPAKKQMGHYKHMNDPALEPGEIRLLKLKRWIPFLGVRADLHHVKLADKPVYEAISYTWGTSNEEREVSINGRPFVISTSTYDALYGRSSMFRLRVLWIDYICIDQTNNLEKGSQVNMMTEIYESATRVVVWLGKTLSARLAIGLLNEMATLPSTVDSYRRYEHLTSSVQWIAMVDFFNLLWFTRVWIVQEVAVATEVIFICGGMTISWDMLVNWTEMFRDPQISALMSLTPQSQNAKRNIINFGSIATLQKRYRIAAPFRKSLKSYKIADAIMEALNRRDPQLGHKPKEPTIMENISVVLLPTSLPFLLTDFGEFDSTDPRDKIFAFTGLATDEPNSAFVPNYTKSVEAVYRETATYLFKGKEPFSVISCAGIGSERKIKLPSWVPDWTSLPANAPFTRPGYFDDLSTDVRCSASGKTKPQVSFDETCPDVLGLGGVIVDEIAYAGRPYNLDDFGDGLIVDEVGNRFSPKEFTENYLWICEAHAVARHASKYGHGNDVIEEAFWRTLIGDQTPWKRPAPDILYRDYVQWFEFSEYNDRIAKEILAKERKSLPTDASYWQTAQDTATWGSGLGTCISMRKFAVTKGGYMAVVPALSEVGDLVSVVCGSRYPLLLRKKPGEQYQNGEMRAFHELVGECYVHGIMDGEMMNVETSVQELLIQVRLQVTNLASAAQALLRLQLPTTSIVGIDTLPFKSLELGFKTSRHTCVTVLVLSWQDEDPKLPVSLEIAQLVRVFKDIYHYNVDEWKIPAKNSHSALNYEIMSFVERAPNDKEHLKIVYFAGHGRLTKTKLLE